MKKVLPCALLLLLAGCAGPYDLEEQAQKLKVKAATTTHQDSELPGQIKGTGWRMRWNTRDPHNINGPTLPVLDAVAQAGHMTDRDDNVYAVLDDVRAQLFREGKPAADITAPRITANRRDRIMIGIGGVRVNSLTDPPDTVITADKITWDTRTGKIVAVGNAQVTQNQENGIVNTHRGGRITFDTTLRSFDVEAE